MGDVYDYILIVVRRLEVKESFSSKSMHQSSYVSLTMDSKKELEI